jgi:hypothetical protein
VVNLAGMYNAQTAIWAFVDLIGDAVASNPVQETFIKQKYVP